MQLNEAAISSRIPRATDEFQTSHLSCALLHFMNILVGKQILCCGLHYESSAM